MQPYSSGLRLFINSVPSNIFSPTLLTLSDILTSLKLVQFSNANSPILSRLSGRIIFFKFLHSAKLELPISFKVLGSSIYFSVSQL